ncbi:MAG: hypothetical protein GY731_04455 [Gammaproteobacteria bacterium]|nr:hypothetical protein [Gammaproteobacteria bacterium]
MKDLKEPLSQEMLNALLDGEFPPEERAEILHRIQDENESAQALCELRTLKDMLRMSYREVPGAPDKKPPSRQWSWPALAAALVLVIIGGLTGWYLHPSLEVPARYVLLDPAGRDSGPVETPGDETRIVFHVTDPDMTAAADLLQEVELVLRHYRQQQQKLRVEVVAHGEGLNLLRSRLSAHGEQIAGLANHYPNLTFVACSNTVRRLSVEKGVEVVLLPEAKLTESGVAHVVRRQQEGWVYIQV